MLRFKIARANMGFIAESGRKGYLDSVGVSQEDYCLINGKKAWSSAEKNRVVQGINALLQGTVSLCGLAPFQLPAEFVAAGIAMWVDPVNIQAACRLMDASRISDVWTIR